MTRAVSPVLFSLIFLISLGEALMGGNAFAQTATPSLPSSQQLDIYVENEMKKLHVPGAAIAVFSNGKITHLKGLGRADDTGTPVTPQTPFQLGSVSKSIAALIVLQLADEGRLSIDDPVSQYLPSFSTSDKAVSDLITIRHLLNHRSGLSTLDGNRNQATIYRGADAMALATAKLKAAKLRGQPGAHFAYSNANYVLLAHLIETVDRRSYEDALEARIFSKLGMKNSYVQIAKPGSMRPAVGHTQWFGYTVERDFVAGRMMAGPGGITASAEDLAIYLSAVFEHDPRIIPTSLSKALTKARRGGYEYGWEFDTIADQKLIFHGGLNPGFYSRVAYNPQTRQGVLILTNMSGSLEGNLVGGTVSYALGLPSEDTAPASVNLLRLWGTFWGAVVLLLGSAFSIRNLLKTKGKASQQSSFAKMMIAFGPSLVLVGFAYFLAFMVPEFSGVNLTAVYMFYPDVGVLLLFSSLIATLWAGLRTWLLVTQTH